MPGSLYAGGGEELKITFDVDEFCQNSQLVKTLAPSQKFSGLKSEYHLWYCMLSQKAVTFLQTKVPKMKMTGVDETDSTSNPKTLWWAWCPSLSVKQVHRHLTRLTEATAFAGKVDFSAELKLGTAGQQVREEALMGKWWTAPVPEFYRDLYFKPTGTVTSAATNPPPEDITPSSRRLSDGQTTMVQSLPEPEEVDADANHHRRSRGRQHPLARSSRHSAVWSLRTLDSDRGPLLSGQPRVVQTAAEGTAGHEMLRIHSEPPLRPLVCCFGGR